MKHLLIPILISTVFIISCTNKSSETAVNDWVMLREDTINTARMGDTLAIVAYVCQGCAYEQSTHFDVVDTSGTVRLEKIVTHEKNPVNTDGGSITKDLLLVPAKPGHAAVRFYRFNVEQPTPEDSAKFTTFEIEVKDKN